MLCWNLGVYLIPNANIKTIRYGAELNLLLKIAEEEKAEKVIFIAREKVMLENYLSIQSPFYQKKFREAGITFKDADSLNTVQKSPVYTDVYNYPMPVSRNSMLNKQQQSKPKSATVNVSIPTLYGELYIYKLSSEK
jgi:hypothetical protein